MVKISRDYQAVQGEAAIESMRRILFTFWFFVPMEIALALWYVGLQGASAPVQTQVWARSLMHVHILTASVSLALTLVVSIVLRRQNTSIWITTVLQSLMCFCYLFYGIALAYFDIKVGGVSAFILVCFAVAGLSLMRPFVSIVLFGSTALGVLAMLSMSGVDGAQLSIMKLNSLTAIVLAVVLATIIFHQYAKGLLLLRELENMAEQDPLTSLPNRRKLKSRLNSALRMTARTDKYGALMFLDLDNFKNINDTRGHHMGDQLLKEVGHRLLTCVRDADLVARLGGDEFVVMLENLGDDTHTAARHVDIVGQKILLRLNESYILTGIEQRCTPSIGVTLFSGEDQSVDELMKQADFAMYQSKDAGRNTIRFYDANMQAHLVESAAMESALREGIARGQLVLHYQPQVTASGRICGAEALVRWHHPSFGMISPNRFIPLAEEVGLILPLGNWVLETACRQLASWALQGHLANLSIAVNVSSIQFHQAGFVDTVVDILRTTGADPRLLKLELTESLLVSKLDEVSAKMRVLSDMGIRISLDDFGTGYSSLSYLKKMPLDQLKIDQSFIQDIVDDANGSALASIIIQLSKTLGLDVIAEGVENEFQRDVLTRLGCEHFQGYLYSRPLVIDSFEVLLDEMIGNVISVGS